LLSFVWLLRKYREIRLLILYVPCFYIISDLFVSVLFIYNIFCENTVIICIIDLVKSVCCVLIFLVIYLKEKVKFIINLWFKRQNQKELLIISEMKRCLGKYSKMHATFVRFIRNNNKGK
jgi:hypothetical protein